MIVTIYLLDLPLRIHSVTTANKRCEFDACPLRDVLDTALTFVSEMYSIQPYVITFVSDLR